MTLDVNHAKTKRPVDSATTIAAACDRDRSFVRGLAARYSNQIGFIPLQGLGEYIDAGGVTLARENGDPAGYLLAGRRVAAAPWIRPIYQAAVCFDARRRAHGIRLVDDLAAAALITGQRMLQCWCRQDLEANDFWKAAGFVLVASRSGTTARGHASNLWRRPVVECSAAELQAIARPRRNHGPGGDTLPSTAAPAFTYTTAATQRRQQRPIALDAVHAWTATTANTRHAA